MTDMRCTACGRYGIYWAGWLFDQFTHTKCPHCGGVNTHDPPGPEPDPDDPDDPQGE